MTSILSNKRGFKTFRFITHVGEMEIIQFNRYVKYVLPKEVITKNGVHVPRPTLDLKLCFENTPPKNVLPTSDYYTAKVISKGEAPISEYLPNYDARFTGNLSSDAAKILEELVFERQIYNFCLNEIKSLIAKKKPSFYKPAFNGSSIQELIDEYAKQMGSPNLIGMHINLSDYQKFFVILQKDTFKFYFKTLFEVHNKITSLEQTVYWDIRGFLLEMLPNSWVIGRSDDPAAYLHELNEDRRIQGDF